MLQTPAIVLGCLCLQLSVLTFSCLCYRYVRQGGERELLASRDRVREIEEEAGRLLDEKETQSVELDEVKDDLASQQVGRLEDSLKTQQYKIHCAGCFQYGFIKQTVLETISGGCLFLYTHSKTNKQAKNNKQTNKNKISCGLFFLQRWQKFS